MFPGIAVITFANRSGLIRAVESYSGDAKPGSEAMLNALAGELFAAAKSARAALRSANKEARLTLNQTPRDEWRRLSHDRI